MNTIFKTLNLLHRSISLMPSKSISTYFPVRTFILNIRVCSIIVRTFILNIRVCSWFCITCPIPQVWISSLDGSRETANYLHVPSETWRALDYLDCVSILKIKFE